MNEILYFIAASIALTLLPGPDFLAVVTLALTRGAKSAMLFASGLCSGLLFHIFAASVGLGLLLKTHPESYTWLRLGGLVYLSYLGLRSLWSYFKASKSEEVLPIQNGAKLYQQGILMNVLNPKVTLFFLSFFPQFMNPVLGVWGHPLTLGAIFIGQALLIFFVVSHLGGRVTRKISLNIRAIHLTEGILYLGIALMLNF